MHITVKTKITLELLDKCGDRLFPISSKMRLYGTAAFAIAIGVLALAFSFTPEGINLIFAVIAGVLMIGGGSIIYNTRSLISKYIKRAKIGIKEQFEEGCDYIEQEIVFEDDRMRTCRTGASQSSAIVIEYRDITRFDEVCCQDGQAVFIAQSISGNSVFICTGDLSDEEDSELMTALKAAGVKVHRKTKRNGSTD